eukprot:Phypoly_transcript_24583.p1 GENE.Phypoly_transcript_24583~~Phypoly_transcript_24583.p1  ORF type:complete len:111 (+),score=14.85 Phypoly_transcript_24583:3-335(+)
MKKSLEKFRMLVSELNNNRFIYVILLFADADLFEKKLATVPLTTVFPDFAFDPNVVYSKTRQVEIWIQSYFTREVAYPQNITVHFCNGTHYPTVAKFDWMWRKRIGTITV